MKIVAISDTHNRHRELTIPKCDLLIHAGDASFLGDEEEMEDFEKWFLEQPAVDKVFVPGNHEVGYYHQGDWRYSNSYKSQMLSHTLIDSSKVSHIHIYGSPWTYVSPKWAFQFPWYERDLAPDNPKFRKTQKSTWAKIPEDVDILVTHAPPYGILDNVPSQDLRYINPNDPLYPLAKLGNHCGDKILAEEIQKRKKLKYHFFGHIHEGYGHKEVDGVKYYNVAVCDRNYEPTNPVTIVEID